MKYDFDKIIDRRGTGSLKHEYATERGRSADLLPMWVADMDFLTAPEVIDALVKAASHGIYGYTEPPKDYFDTVSEWFTNRHGFTPKKEWQLNTPGVVFALAVAVKAYTNVGDAVLIMRPVYYPFTEVISDNRRVVVSSSLITSKTGETAIDFDDFERAVITNKVKLFLLCNPHNPVGKVWTKNDLLRMGDICKKHGVIVVADEIHCEFIYAPNKHVCWFTLSDFADFGVLCTSQGKTFNLAGLQISDIFIKNEKLRAAFKAEISGAGYSQLNYFSYAGGAAAYKYGGEWLSGLLEYLDGNRRYISEHLTKKIKYTPPEGTYLAWLDLRGLNLSPAYERSLIEEKAGLWLDRGAMFGAEGAGFERLNFACPKSVLASAVERLNKAVDGL